MNNRGILYGIGVGPGDPDLLTLKAVKVLADADVILAASSTKNDYSTALDIAAPHLKEGARVEQLGFPMTKDMEEMQAAWDENAKRTLALLDEGLNAAFLTLGDPLTYSTFGYLLRTVMVMEPDTRIVTVPGITSYQAAAARIGLPLVEGKESLIIAPGVCESERLEELLKTADNAVILKTYKNFAEIRQSLENQRLAEDTVLVTRLGMEGESVLTDISDAPEKPHYFSLALVKKKHT